MLEREDMEHRHNYLAKSAFRDVGPVETVVSSTGTIENIIPTSVDLVVEMTARDEEDVISWDPATEAAPATGGDVELAILGM